MTDEELQEALRAFDAAGGEEGTLARVVGAHERHEQPLPHRVLAALPDWIWLKTLLATWYARPLSRRDGCSEDEIVAAESRLGFRFPPDLRNWYRLVSARIEASDESLVALPDLCVNEVEAGVCIWRSISGTAGAFVTGASNRVEVRVDGAPVSIEVPTVLAFVKGRLCFDLLASAVEHDGVLGRLRASVRGGANPEHQQIMEASLPRLAIPTIYEAPFHGDSETLTQEGMWATATKSALDRLSEICR